MAQKNELKILKIILAVLTTGLVIVGAFIVRREIIRNQAMENIDKNNIDVAIAESDVNAKDSEDKDIALIKEFYSHVLYISEDECDVTKYLSKDLAERIYETEYEDTYSIWEFRTGVNGCLEDKSELISITTMQSGWYEVAYWDGGYKGRTRVHMSNGLIDDYKLIEVIPDPEVV